MANYVDNDRDEMFRRYMSEQMAVQTKLLERIDQSARVVKVLAVILLVLLALSFIGALINAAS